MHWVVRAEDKTISEGLSIFYFFLFGKKDLQLIWTWQKMKDKR